MQRPKVDLSHHPVIHSYHACSLNSCCYCLILSFETSAALINNTPTLLANRLTVVLFKMTLFPLECSSCYPCLLRFVPQGKYPLISPSRVEAPRLAIKTDYSISFAVINIDVYFSHLSLLIKIPYNTGLLPVSLS